MPLRRWSSPDVAVPRSGLLGVASLGSLLLGAPAIWGTAPAPTTIHARSAISDAGKTSAISAAGARSAISAASVKGGIE